jgi:hypothetical protein
MPRAEGMTPMAWFIHNPISTMPAGLVVGEACVRVGSN